MIGMSETETIEEAKRLPSNIISFSLKPSYAKTILEIKNRWKNEGRNVSNEICVAMMYWDAQMNGAENGKVWPRINEPPRPYLWMCRTGLVSKKEMAELQVCIRSHAREIANWEERLEHNEE